MMPHRLNTLFPALLALCVGTSGVSLLAQEGAADSHDLVVVAAELHLGGGEVHAPGFLAVRAGKIVATGPAPEVGEGSIDELGGSAKRRLDLRASGAVIIPGLVEAISHAGLRGGDAENEEASEVNPTLRIANAYEAGHPSVRRMLEQGITSMIVQPGERNVVGGLSAWVKTLGSSLPEAARHDQLAMKITLGTAPARGNRSTRSTRISMWSRQPLSRMSTIFLVREAFVAAERHRARRRMGLPVADDPKLDMLARALAGEVTIHWQARTESDIRSALRIAKEFGVPRNVLLEGHEVASVADEIAEAGWPVLMGPLYHPQYRGRGGRGGLPNTETDALLSAPRMEAGDDPARMLAAGGGTMAPAWAAAFAPTGPMMNLAGSEVLPERLQRLALGLMGSNCSACLTCEDCVECGACESCNTCVERANCAFCSECKSCSHCRACDHGTTACSHAGACAHGVSFGGYGADPFGVEAENYDADEEARNSCRYCCGLATSPLLPDDTEFTALALGRIATLKVPVAFARGSSTEGDRLLDFVTFATRHGVSAPRALDMVTLVPARIAGLDERIGSLATGRDADFVVLGAAPTSPTAGVVQVWIEGRLAYDRDAAEGGKTP